MCRLFSVTSLAAQPVADLVSESVLSSMNELSYQHKDGWGISWQDGPNLGLMRDSRAGFETDDMAQALSKITTNQLNIHLRWASEDSPIKIENCHPFIEGDISFMQNGEYPAYERVKTFLTQQGGRLPVGDTDSEIFFGLVLFHAQTIGFAEALKLSSQQVTEFSIADFGLPPRALNSVLTTPDKVYVYSQNEPSLLKADQGPDNYILYWNQNDSKVTIASQGVDIGQSEPLTPNKILIIDRQDLTVAITD